MSTLLITCNSQEKEVNLNEFENAVKDNRASQIAQYVVKVFEDSKGNLWFGTLENGVAKYDGNTLKYFTTADGLPSNRVVNIIEDSKGILWFGTGNGLSKYDGKTFINFKTEYGICNNMISNLLIDTKGIFWIGTWNGICQFDGTTFKTFSVPYPTIETPINEDTENWMTDITEDTKGNIWFARDGYGACKYNGKSFTHFLKKDGLLSNNVTEIEFDKDGNIWFGMRVVEKDNTDATKRFGAGGITKFNGKVFEYFPEIKGFNEADVYEIYKDNLDNLWISTTHNGIYKFDGKAFKNYNIPISIMNITEDKKGNLWLGGAGGLYKITQKGEVLNITQNGPWE